MKIKNLIAMILFVLFALVARSIYAEEAADEYFPYPIIFIHGLDSNPSISWDTTIAEFKKYFYNEDGTCKYFDYGGDYLIALDYEKQNNGDIPTIARTALKPKIDETISKLPDGHKKVIIVAHSMGGLVTRSLLKQYPEYQDKIEKVVFIGTPHQGSPLASGVILIDRMIPELEKGLKNNKWSIFNFDLKLPGQFWAYRNRYQQMKKTLNLYKFFVAFNFKIRIKNMLRGDPLKDKGQGGRYDRTSPHSQGQGVAIGQLVIPETVTAKKTFAEKIMLGPFTVAETAPLTVTSSYEKTDTFLNNNNFAIPDKFAIIEGTGSLTSLGAWCMGKTSGGIFEYLADFEGLPAGNTLAELDEGDGIVTPASQTALASDENCQAVYEVNRCHITETKDCETILQALDENPIIENVRLVCKYKDYEPYWQNSHRYYLIIKLKDYLLADIEISELNLYRKTLEDFPEFCDSKTNTYKPYVKFGEEFLKERTDKEAPILEQLNFLPPIRWGVWGYLHLYPGEFYIEYSHTWEFQDPNGYLKLKNSAGEEAEIELIDIATSGTLYLHREGHAESINSYSEARSQAINNYLSDGGNFYYAGGALAAIISGESYHEKESIIDDEGNIIGMIDRWTADVKTHSPCYNKFNLSVGERKIKSVKVAGVFAKYKEYHRDFSLLVYRDDSNTWPPQKTTPAGTFLFSLDSATLQDNKMESYYYTENVEVNIDPEKLNLNGENIWFSQADIPFDAFLPMYGTGGDCVIVDIVAPKLVIIYDNDDVPAQDEE